MSCPDCGDDRLRLAVPTDYRAFAPDDAARVSVCRTCLRVRPASVDAPDDASATDDPTPLGEWVPSGEAGVGVVLLVSLLDSLALNRSRIERLVARVERDGADPLLSLDRLATAGRLDPFVDLDRRRPQLRQFLDAE
jgi:hypothetical protein